jgi:hypothetical protein
LRLGDFRRQISIRSPFKEEVADAEEFTANPANIRLIDEAIRAISD